MNLSDLNVDVFLKYVRQVNQQLEDQDSMARLLDAARDEPIIEGLLRQYMLVVHMESGPIKRKVLAMAQRDLVVFLALWLMEREKQVVTAFHRN